MKKSILALVIASIGFGMGSAHAVVLHGDGDSSLELGGRIEATGTYAGDDVADLSRARINLDGKMQVTENVKMIAFFEHQFNSNEDLSHIRGAYTGLTAGNHTVTYGLSLGAFNQLTDFTDVMAYNGASAGAKLSVAGPTSGSLKYEYVTDKINLKANVVGDGNISGGAISVKYFTDYGLTVGAGGAQQSTDLGNTNEDVTQLMAGLGYQTGDLYLGALGTAKTGDIEYQGYEIVAKYDMDKVTYAVSYEVGMFNDTKFEDINNLTASAAYSVKPNLVAYVSGVIDTAETGDSKATAGMKYMF